MDIGQGFTLSSILFTIYIASIFHIFENYKKSNANLFYSYSIISSLFNQVRLVIKYDKSEIFHFSKSTKNTWPPPLDFQPLKRSLLHSKNK